MGRWLGGEMTRWMDEMEDTYIDGLIY